MLLRAWACMQDMHPDLRVRMCMHTSATMLAGMRADGHADMCADVCVDMSVGVCVDMRAGVRTSATWINDAGHRSY